MWHAPVNQHPTPFADWTHFCQNCGSHTEQKWLEKEVECIRFINVGSGVVIPATCHIQFVGKVKQRVRSMGRSGKWLLGKTENGRWKCGHSSGMRFCEKREKNVLVLRASLISHGRYGLFLFSLIWSMFLFVYFEVIKLILFDRIIKDTIYMIMGKPPF